MGYTTTRTAAGYAILYGLINNATNRGTGMSIINDLNTLRAIGGKALTQGLEDSVIERFAATDQQLSIAVNDAVAKLQELQSEHADLLAMDEADMLRELQSDYVNFYADDAINPYVTLAAKGPWVVTVKGAVLHDNGGYGMLGFGHAPQAIIDTMSEPHVMANVMSPNISHKRFANALRKELGHTRGHCPFARFLCLNSGSEAVTVAARISDIHAKVHTDPTGPNAGKTIKVMALEGGFHGRTDRPAQYSDSTRNVYRQHLASFRDRDNLIAVPPNDVAALEAAFARAEREGVFIESLFMEPVMGEGNPGEAITPEFYAAARRLTQAHDTLLLIDSIQAGLRGHGVLSIIDYPGFEHLDAPDMETYSKALNGGQYPMSVLALTEKAVSIYRKGVYGNTMTANPRALDIGTTVLGLITDSVRQNIRRQGQAFKDKFLALQAQMPDVITNVQGTGLLFSIELNGNRYKSYGTDSIEEYMRINGLNVIHGGENSLRFTPHFNITDAEVDMIIDATHHALIHGPVKQAAEAA